MLRNPVARRRSRILTHPQSLGLARSASTNMSSEEDILTQTQSENDFKHVANVPNTSTNVTHSVPALSNNHTRISIEINEASPTNPEGKTVL